jgi:hypothetical protein
MTPDDLGFRTMADVDLNPQQEVAIERMMKAIVDRDEAAVAELVAYRRDPPNVYAAPADNFWMWADVYGDDALRLVMPPGEVAEWGVWGFPLRERPNVLALHVDVWSDNGRTDLTVQFDLVPDEDGYRVELDDMHVM